MTEDNSRFIVQAAKERHRRSVQRVLEVLRRFDRDGVPITFVGVAAAASVSRPWLYREPQLRAEILRRRSTLRHPDAAGAGCTTRFGSSLSTKRSRCSTKSSGGSKRTMCRLRSELERSLGEQRLAAAGTRNSADNLVRE